MLAGGIDSPEAFQQLVPPDRQTLASTRRVLKMALPLPD